MNKVFLGWIGMWLLSYGPSWAQRPSASFDTLVKPTEEKVRLAKISHAEPLYLDLVRDLGARRGEREWNVGTEFSQQKGATSWHPFIEYEFAPVNRLGLEIELPGQVSLADPDQGQPRSASWRLHSIKTSIQWTYAVLERWQTSLAVGYTNELMLPPAANTAGFSAIEAGHPFLVAAKKWGAHWHTLVYASWAGELSKQGSIQAGGHELNIAVHYVIPHSKAFMGVELYQSWPASDALMIRPQVRIALKNNVLLGLVGNMPLNQSTVSSWFIRLIYEPRRSAR
ncbi:hypothetical protein M0L20_29270 [Spirosoma sp. RP8]|uniref:Phosphoribosylformylglycinamidine synthase n=1 Tax=Spirosoma liriopis TaxID=2937440 RepID=A0ABT0HUW3_9BACT|nr:HAEPLYID family protein [Spirosoma liriopis]MCK8495992.1 hypothetical protein [Spirosoma liriopis]